MGFKLGNQSLKNLEGVHPDLVDLVKIIIQTSKQDFTVTSGLRTKRQQKVLYNRGASKLDGERLISKHQKQPDGYGHAVDLVPYMAGIGPRWEWSLIYPIASAMSMAVSLSSSPIDIIWGGVWDIPMSKYAGDVNGMHQAVEEYKIRHKGVDFLDGPHYQIVV